MSGTPRVVLAFDSMKGSLSAARACRIVSQRLSERWRGSIEVLELPMADGGEGSLEQLQAHSDLLVVQVSTVDAIGRPIVADYLFDSHHGEAHIEVSRSVGLPQVSDVPLQPLNASSFGAGLMVVDAVQRGARRLNLLLGGSATTDGGMGLMHALGCRFFDSDGRDLPLGGGSLDQLDRIDVTALASSAREVEWAVVTDVDARLVGPNGAARQYAPQKGALLADVEVLERGLTRLADVLKRDFGSPVLEADGLGAAGGMAVLPTVLCGSQRLRGGEFFAERLGLKNAIQCADLVITGEGRFDHQSLDGKVVGTIVECASRVRPSPPVIVLAGEVDHGSLERETVGVQAAFSIAEGPSSLTSMQRDVERLLIRRAEDVVEVFMAGRSSAVSR